MHEANTMHSARVVLQAAAVLWPAQIGVGTAVAGTHHMLQQLFGAKHST